MKCIKILKLPAQDV